VAGRRIAASEVSHVVSFSLESLLAGALAKRRNPKIKLIFDSNELHIEAYVHPVKKKLWAPIQKFCIQYCDVIMHAEENRLEYFKKHHDPSNRNQFLLENLPYYIPSERLKKRIFDPPLRVLYVGVLGFDRYTRELIQIFRDLAPDYSLDLVGPCEASVKEELEGDLRMNPAPNIRILPGIPHAEMAKLIEDYHVGIALYKNTNLCNYYCAPNKVYDYLMNGIPVIANNYPGLVSVLEKAKLGACVENVDFENFKAALEVIRDERRWKNITDAVRRRYSWEAQKPGFLELFR
jgi:glycosyltransferase involved in cell wall biosynthesis